MKKTKRPTICFATMCKNEAHCITETLEAVAPYVTSIVVYDTGSTDQTIEKVEDFEHAHPEIAVIAVQAKWEGFAISKTKMMAKARGKADYILHLDADDRLVAFDPSKIDRSCHQFLATLTRGTSTWQATILYDGKLKWKFCGVAHTILRCLDKATIKTGTLDGCQVQADELGARAADPLKYAKDAELLVQQYKDTTKKDPDKLHARSAFYAAQSYFDAGMLDNAFAWYGTYIEAPTWNEEVFEASLRRARILMLQGSSPQAEIDAATRIASDRAEPHLYYGTWLNQQSRHAEAYKYLKIAQTKNLAVTQLRYLLFVDARAYGKWVNDELAVAAYWTERYPEAKALINEIIDDPDFASVRPRLLDNLAHTDRKLAERNASPAFVLTGSAPKIIVVNDFYTEPLKVRETALGLAFIESPTYHKGRRTVVPVRNDLVRHEFERLLGKRITKWDYPTNGVFQQCVHGDPLVYHCDDQQYAAAIYLTPGAPLNTGTSFYRDKKTKALSLKDSPPPTFERGFYEADQFDLIDQVGNVFNRCVIWDARLIHSASGYFGMSTHDCRLFQLFFFDAD